MKLTDTQRTLLEAAAQHPQKQLINFPDTLKGGARIKVLTSMHNAELIEPSAAEPEVFAATHLQRPVMELLHRVAEMSQLVFGQTADLTHGEIR